VDGSPLPAAAFGADADAAAAWAGAAGAAEMGAAAPAVHTSVRGVTPGSASCTVLAAAGDAARDCRLGRPHDDSRVLRKP
jgi:hypothetical protein